MLEKILGKWFTQSVNEQHFAAIRCEDCQNIMRAQPGRTVTCGRDGKTYTAPDSFIGLNPLVTLKDLRQARRKRLAPITALKKWQEQQGFGVTERKWRERMHQLEKEEAARATASV
jgi:ribosomal protein S27E